MRLPNPANAIETALKQLETIGSTFEFRSTTISCLVGEQTIVGFNEQGGSAETKQITLAFRKSLITDDIYPAEGDPIVFNELEYYVDTVTTNATDTFMTLALTVTK